MIRGKPCLYFDCTWQSEGADEEDFGGNDGDSQAASVNTKDLVDCGGYHFGTAIKSPCATMKPYGAD